jgi:hypothetical protein
MKMTRRSAIISSLMAIGDELRVHINTDDHQAAKVYVMGLNDGLESAAVSVEGGSFMSKEAPVYKWAIDVAKMIRANKSEPVEAVSTTPHVVKNKSTKEGREFWDHVESIAEQTRAKVSTPLPQQEIPSKMCIAPDGTLCPKCHPPMPWPESVALPQQEEPALGPKESRFMAIMNNIKDEESDYIIGRCIPLLQILLHEGNEQAKEILDEIKEYCAG